jgi:hypothetical protein
MALTHCPKCGKMMSTSAAFCSHCGSANEPQESVQRVARRASSPRRPLHSLSVGSAVPGTPDADRWIRFWSNLCGGMLIVGFLCPMIIDGFRGSHLMWQWDLMSSMKGDQILGMIRPLILGFATLAVGNLVGGIQRAVALFAMAGGTWVLYAVLARAPEMDLANLSAKSGGAILLLIIMPFSACTIAIGNRIRKRYPTDPLPRTLAGVAGIVLASCFIIPLGGGRDSYPIIAAFFEKFAWRTAGPIMVVFLGLLLYGILGALSFLRVRDVASFCRLLSILARTILWGAPLPNDLDLAADGGRLEGVALTLVAGTRDGFLTPKVLASEEARLRARGIPYRIVPFEGGHEMDPDVLRTLAG